MKRTDRKVKLTESDMKVKLAENSLYDYKLIDLERIDINGIQLYVCSDPFSIK